GNSWTEGPFVIKHKETYYLMYSGNFYGSSAYAIGYATASHPLGPWTKHQGNPILKQTDRVSGPGHNSVVASPDGTEFFIVYHTHQSFAGGGARQLAIDRLRFVEKQESLDELEVVAGPSVLTQPLPSGALPFPAGKSDDFDGETLDRSLWTVFNEDLTKWRLEDGKLIIRTQKGMVHTTNANLRNLFLQYAPEGDFLFEVRLNYSPVSLYDHAFLMVWHDHNNYIQFSKMRGGSGEVYVCGIERNGEFSSYSAAKGTDALCHLRIIRRGTRIEFFGSDDGSNWDRIGNGYNATSPQAKIGFGAASPYSGSERDVTFEWFKVLGQKDLKPVNMMLR
ncbi:MAG TPA: family 43 glycosylhydrolase, partial [bacterium]|nr:family 43 glycosylhydrolase [bacterium]